MSINSVVHDTGISNYSNAFGEQSAMYLPYVYFIRNKITNEFYYGSRYHNIKLKRTPEEDFWIHYFTSSKRVNKLIEKYGKDSFEIQIIMIDENYDKCYLHEQSLIEQALGGKLCLNGHCTKNGKFSTAGNTTSLETKFKISNSRKGEKNVNYGKPAHNKGKPGLKWSEERKAEHSAKLTGRKREPFTEQTRAKMSAAKKGKKRNAINIELKDIT